MNGRTTNLGRIFGAAWLALAVLGAAGCPGDDNGDNSDGGMTSGGGLGSVLAKQCGLSCPEAGKGVASGNASISGYGPIDGFFRSVVNYSTVAAGVSADIDAELNGIQSLFAITDAQLTASGSLGAAITAKLASDFKAKIVVDAQPAQCSVDAHVAAEVSAKCQAEAKCNVTPGMASFQCMGTCNVDANVSGSCSADAKVHCQVTAPSIQCMGQCSGSCTVTTPTVKCGGTCKGTCDGMCTGGGTSGTGVMGECTGTCGGTCTGGCEVSGMAAATCAGTCSGSCDYNPPSGTCEASAKVSCDLMGSASASCTGRCDGNFVPPSAMCDASASCQASAKAEARFQVHCTPPSVQVRVLVEGGAMAQTQVTFLIAELKARLPRLAVANARAKLAAQAAGELSANGTAAVQSTVSALANAKLDFFVGVKVATCVPAQLTEAQGVIQTSSDSLKKRTDAAASVATSFGMVM